MWSTSTSALMSWSWGNGSRGQNGEMVVGEMVVGKMVVGSVVDSVVCQRHYGWGSSSWME